MQSSLDVGYVLQPPRSRTKTRRGLRTLSSSREPCGFASPALQQLAVCLGWQAVSSLGPLLARPPAGLGVYSLMFAAVLLFQRPHEQVSVYTYMRTYTI